MKRSAIYNLAIMAVIEDQHIDTCIKADVIETLLDDRKLAKWNEDQEAKNNESVSN